MLGQLMIIGISGTHLKEDEKKFIIENDIGGIILFDRNIQDPLQLRTLTEDIQNLRHHTKSKSPFYISIDMEGGRVQRLKTPFTKWPALRKLGQIDSPTASFNFAFQMGQELKAVGINLDFAPCVDIFSNPENKVIGDRSIGSDPELVAKHASALVRGYLKSEVIPCVKHFPGHGNTLLDSHEDLPVEFSDFDRLESVELIPFKKSFKARADLVMSSHILFKNIDPNWPVTLSEIFINQILKEKLRYRGLVITDDLGMKALTKLYSTEKIAVRALQAGVDILLYCNEPQSPPQAIEAIKKALSEQNLSEESLEKRIQNILQHKSENIKNPALMEKNMALNIIGHPEHFKLAQDIFDGKLDTY